MVCLLTNCNDSAEKLTAHITCNVVQMTLFFFFLWSSQYVEGPVDVTLQNPGETVKYKHTAIKDYHPFLKDNNVIVTVTNNKAKDS